ncbi:MAG: alpha-galactosidase [Armatimonadota bacterium]|nr:alpha-galactosidase [Armatimonadota bacterium]
MLKFSCLLLLLAYTGCGAAGGEEMLTTPSFSFLYDGKPSCELLNRWGKQSRLCQLDSVRKLAIDEWTDRETGLRVTREAIFYSDFPAVDWVVYFENTGSTDTPLIEDIQAADIRIEAPRDGTPYLLHRTKGAPADPSDFEVSIVPVDELHPQLLSAGGGRSSNKDFPFFKVETGFGALIAAVGWSGQWQAQLRCSKRAIVLRAGMELTRFKLHPGEKVRTPRILILEWHGDSMEANAQFRQLIYKHYCAKINGRTPLPILFVNTCFTRGGGWLNECNAENQISLIKAYAPLGVEALITDAGWFEGGWPAGAGNWTPRKDAYPNGIEPVARTALENGMVYGLWFEPERVVAGTPIHKEHPEWCLASQPNPQDTYLLNFGLPEVQEYFFGIVKRFMDIPGFRFYRQDFNMDPLPYWRYNDPPDRQGITEIKYIEGLYAYWDRLAREYPDSIREECASGGRRIDLETIKRMHLHQESDYWFDNDVDQAQIWGLSQYLPNNTFDTPLVRLDDYSFHSTMACSLIPAWIADDPKFDSALAKKLLDKYRQLRHLLVGAWYPLLPYSREPKHWMAYQFHRPDLNEGFVLVFRRAECANNTVEIRLHGLDPKADYEVRFDGSGDVRREKGSQLMQCLSCSIGQKPGSELIHYRLVQSR